VLDDDETGAVRYRMQKRHRAMLRREFDDVNDGLIAVRMPPHGMVQHGAPEQLIRSTMVRPPERERLIRFMPGD